MKQPDDPIVLGGFVPLVDNIIMGMEDNPTAIYFPIDGQYEPVVVRRKRYCCEHNGMWHIVKAVR